MTTPNYTIEPYTHDHDAALAVMWNESDDEWPTSFTDGVPFTAERVGEWMDKEVALMRLVVIEENGPIVGFGSLWDSTDRRGESCYVDLLNVHPDYQGRSLGRRILAQMLDYATEQGYQHVTLGTWTANLKAVPLYKKTGFFWRPETSVFMENYIPAARQIPVLQGFFQQADWYQDYERTLEQVEDVERHPHTGSMKVYVNRWTSAANGSKPQVIEAIYDLQSQKLCGLETPDFAAFARIDENKPAMGIGYQVVWEIINKQNRPISVTLNISGEKGIVIESESSAAFELGPNQAKEIVSTYRVASDAPKVEDKKWHPKPMPAVSAALSIDEAELTLSAGLYYQKPLEISFYPATLSSLPGQRQTVVVQLQNRLAEPISGELNLLLDDSDMDIETEWQTQPFSVDAEGFASIPITIEPSAPSSTNLHIQATFSYLVQSIQTPPTTLPCLVRSIGDVTAVQTSQGKDDQRIFVENDFFMVQVNHRGNTVNIRSKAGTGHNKYIEDTIGPGFYPFEFGRSHYDIAFEQQPGIVRVTSSIISNVFPGLEFGRELTITPSPLIQVQYRLHHTGEVGAEAHTCRVMTFNGLINLDAINGESTIPLAGGLVQTLATTMPSVDDDFPEKPDDGVGEQWAAYSADGQAHGLIWSPTVSEHKWKRWGIDLFSAEQTIAPQELVEVEPFYLYAGPGDWRDVRRIWQQLSGNLPEVRSPESYYNSAMPVTNPTHQVRLLPEPVATLSSETEVMLQAENVRPIKLNGAVTLDLPDGWIADTERIDLKELVKGNNFTHPLQLKAPAGVGADQGTLRLITQYADDSFPIPLLRLGDVDQSIHVDHRHDSEQPLWHISNGCISFTVAPDFHGGIIEWREGGKTTNHLFTSYPEEGEFKWMKPWFGGVRPMMLTPDSGWPGRLHEVSLVTTKIDKPDQRKLPWSGVRLEGEPIEESAKGVRIQLEYLTLPGSNVIKLVFRRLNSTPVYQLGRFSQPNFGIFCQVDGDMSNGSLHGDYPNVGHIHRKRSEQNADVPVHRWGAVENPDTGRAVAVLAGNSRHRVELEDADSMGGHIWVGDVQDLPPNGSHELVTYLALAQSVDEAKRYSALSALG